MVPVFGCALHMFSDSLILTDEKSLLCWFYFCQGAFYSLKVELHKNFLDLQKKKISNLLLGNM
jgi:hypothetical protein